MALSYFERTGGLELLKDSWCAGIQLELVLALHPSVQDNDYLDVDHDDDDNDEMICGDLI